MAALLLIVLLAAISPTTALASTIQAEFFALDCAQPNAVFPEAALLLNSNNNNTVGMSLSGGGSRSFISSLGVLRALHQLDLAKLVNYSSSVSGGSWANAAYSYRDGTKATLKQFLGRYDSPEELSLTRLQWPLSPKSGLSYPVRRNLIMVLVKEIARSKLEDVWTVSIHRTFLEPAGIRLQAMPTLNARTAARTLGRNPALLNRIELMPVNPNQPFPIINIALLGPSEADVANVNKQRQFAMLHATPLYVGFPRMQNISYTGGVEPLRLGGLMEPLAFGGEVSVANVCGLQACAEPRVKQVPRPHAWFSIANATGASSWAPGSLLVSYQNPAELLRLENILLTTHYLSPWHGGRRSREVFVGDGENVENQGVIALLQRRCRTVLMFVNSATALTSVKHDSILQVRMGHDIDSSFAALFGFLTASTTNTDDYSRDQVFARRDLLRVMHALQDAAQRGRGAVASVQLETMSNAWWGVPGKLKVRLVVNYLARAFDWERALPTDVRERIFGSGAMMMKTDVVPGNGTFRRFPNLSIKQLHLSNEVSRALAGLSTWTVLKNAALYRSAIMEAVGGEEVKVGGEEGVAVTS